MRSAIFTTFSFSQQILGKKLLVVGKRIMLVMYLDKNQ